MLKNKNLILLGTILVAGAITVGGTFAWFTDSDEVVNKMKLARFDVKITEDYEEEEWQDLQPDEVVDKVVKVVNNGTPNAKAVVRIKIEEALKLLKNEDEDLDEVDLLWDAEPIDLEDATRIAVPTYSFPNDAETKTVEEVTYYTAITSLKDGDEQCYVAKIDGYDGLVRYNPTTKELKYAYYEYEEDTIEDVEEYFNPEFDTEKWSKAIDGYYYYKEILNPGETTTPLFSEVKVSEDLPNTYMGAIYTLTPKMEAVQADIKAIESEWLDANGKIDELIKAWGLEKVEEENPTPEEEPQA